MFTLLVWIIVILIVAGLLLWVLSQLPIDATLRKIARVVIIVVVVLWILFLLLGAVGISFPR